MNAVILSIGDELITGEILDTNAKYLSEQCVKNGVMILYRETLPDIKNWIIEGIKKAIKATNLVIISGGLGPTEDDLTREALAEVAKVKLVMNSEALTHLQKWFKARKRKMSNSNKKQALIPEGATLLFNPIGTAPGIKLKIGTAIVFALPGVPNELIEMTNLHIIPELTKVAKENFSFIKTKALHCFGIGESVIGEKIQDLMKSRKGDIVVGTNVSGGVVSIKLRVKGSSETIVNEKLLKLETKIRKRLGNKIFGTDSQTLPSVIAELLKQSNKTISIAESCTAGLLGAALTEQPGASKFFLGGMVVYSNKLKERWLGVSKNILKTKGAVSSTVVKELAKSIIKKTNSDYSLAISGIAGPEGGTPQKPIGTVWIGLGKKIKEKKIKLIAECFHLFGDRAMIRDRAVKCALNLLRLDLIKNINGHTS